MKRIVIVGGGHNGLTCAFYLGRAGHQVTVIERRDVVGGAAVTEEFYPGFRNSVASYSVGLLNPKVIRNMALAQHGLTIVLRKLSYFAPAANGDYLILDRDPNRSYREVARWSTSDANKLEQFHERLGAQVNMMRSVLLETPPNVGGGVRDLITALTVGNRLRRMGMQAQSDLLELFGKSAGDMLDQWFETDVLKGLMGFDAITGNYASPYASSTAYGLLHHVFGEVSGVKGAWGHAIGGMGAITQVMARACRQAGVEIRTRSSVREVIVTNKRAAGVVLESSARIEADAVVSNINPRLLYGDLVAEDHLPPDFQSRIQGWKCGSGTFRMNVALGELPNFSCLPSVGPAEHHGARIIIAPSLKYLDQCFMDARQYGWSRRPSIDMQIPSLADDTLAPPGRHVVSLFCQHFAPDLPDGRSWDEHREQAADLVINTIIATRRTSSPRSSVE